MLHISILEKNYILFRFLRSCSKINFVNEVEIEIEEVVPHSYIHTHHVNWITNRLLNTICKRTTGLVHTLV